jgi:hypothetical protein
MFDKCEWAGASQVAVLEGPMCPTRIATVGRPVPVV